MNNLNQKLLRIHNIESSDFNSVENALSIIFSFSLMAKGSEFFHNTLSVDDIKTNLIEIEEFWNEE
jgi:hypothetical protein